MTALLVSALEHGAIDAALVIGREADRPWVPTARLVDRVDDVIGCAQATYCLTPNLQLLRDTSYERVGVVGLPCQVQALHRMGNHVPVPAVAQRVALVIEIACASSTRREGTEHLIRDRLQLPLEDVSRLRYRAGDYPGRFTVWDREGEQHSLPFHELVTTFKKFKQFRCHACPDWWSGLADISIADGDPNIFATSRSGLAATKSSAMLVRTARGQEAVEQARASDHLVLERDEFRPEASLGLQRKRHRYGDLAARLPADAVPAPPVEGAEVEQPLADGDLIERMSAR